MKTILIPDRSTNADIEKSIFGSNYNFIIPNAKENSEISDKDWSSCDGILAWHDLIYNEEIIEKLIKCKGIVRVGTGYDNVDLKSCQKKGITVSNVPDYGTEDVADHTFALILANERNIINFNQAVKDKLPWDWSLGKDLSRIREKVFGIIGLGRIGMAVALRAKAFGFNVNFFDPYKSNGIEKSLNLSRSYSLKELSGQADIISIHTPLNNETKGMINKSFFKTAKKGISIYNTARGEIINLDHLFDSIKEGIVDKAGLDVLDNEPINYENNFIKAWVNDDDWISGKLIITPHAAFYNKESYFEMRKKAAEELKCILENKNSRYSLF